MLPDGAAAGAERALADRELANAPRGDETMLLVEDEDAVRELDRQVARCARLPRAGRARRRREALAIARGRARARFDLLLTDVVMPTMSGRELADILQALQPDMKVLYMSGYTDDAVVRHGVSEASMAFIQKPFAARAGAQGARGAGR